MSFTKKLSGDNLRRPCRIIFMQAEGADNLRQLLQAEHISSSVRAFKGQERGGHGCGLQWHRHLIAADIVFSRNI